MNEITRYPHLFQPIRLGGTYFRNRIFSAPAGLLDLTPNCAPSFDHLSYWERKAKGGAASINIGESYVCDYDSGDSRYDVFLMKDRKYNYNGLAKLADCINRQGAVATIELQHPGCASKRNGELQLAPSAGPNPLDPSIMCKEMTEEDIYRVIDEFSEAALYAKSRGFGMVQVHGGHGWLINQFFSPFFNKRTDRWGGSVENRARFGVAVVDEIHRKCGKDFPVEIRISGTELFEGGYGIEGGIDFAKQLEGHADLIHISVGNPHHAGSAEYTHPGIFNEGGCNIPFAAEITKHVSKPVATLGGLNAPAQMEEIISSGKADIVYMARALLADPYLPQKVMSNKDEDIVRCLRCFTCMAERAATA
ncbi:MAG: NADH:flavin oxidoreductase, partial [Clostridia bacterium]|nr:NADH:flavin oxidoreductase [Clostridia bacterium]